jgi:hypothetical protein
VGHNCRIGSGHIIYPARTIESDVVLAAKAEQTIITKNVSYEGSDHLNHPGSNHKPKYHDDYLLLDDAIAAEELKEQTH